jgi:transcriptional regulator with XRE-family HTH domain
MGARGSGFPGGVLDSSTLAGARRACGLTQGELAQRLRVPRSLIGHWETGVRAIPPERSRALQRALARQQQRPARGRDTLTAASLRVIRKEPGLSRGVVVLRLGRRRGADAAIAALLEHGEIHERLHDVVNARGQSRQRLGLFVGPADSLFADAPADIGGDALRLEREVLGLTQTELAVRVGVSAQLVGLWESGQRRLTAARLAALVAALQPDGAQLRALRESYGWSQRAIAMQLHVQPSTWCQWENGKRSLDRPRWLALRAQLEQVGAAPTDAALNRAVAHLVAATGRHAGRTRSYVLATLHSPLGETALHVALARELVHERDGIVEQRGPHGEVQQRVRRGLYPGRAAAALSATATRVMPGGELRAARESLRWTQAQLAAAVDVSEGLVRRWERTHVPSGRVAQLRALFKSTSRVVDDERIVRVLRAKVVELATAHGGLSRFELARRIGASRPALGGLVSAALTEALAHDEVHERVVETQRGTRIGLFAGVAPSGWQPPPLSGRELRDRREALELTARELGQQLGVSHELVFTWERERQPIPAARRAQLHQVLAEPEFAPIEAAAIAAGRRARGYSQAELGRRLEVSQATISGWEHGSHVPLHMRPRLRAQLGL